MNSMDIQHTPFFIERGQTNPYISLVTQSQQRVDGCRGGKREYNRLVGLLDAARTLAKHWDKWYDFSLDVPFYDETEAKTFQTKWTNASDIQIDSICLKYQGGNTLFRIINWFTTTIPPQTRHAIYSVVRISKKHQELMEFIGMVLGNTYPNFNDHIIFDEKIGDNIDIKTATFIPYEVYEQFEPTEPLCREDCWFGAIKFNQHQGIEMLCAFSDGKKPGNLEIADRYILRSHMEYKGMPINTFQALPKWADGPIWETPLEYTPNVPIIDDCTDVHGLEEEGTVWYLGLFIDIFSVLRNKYVIDELR